MDVRDSAKVSNALGRTFDLTVAVELGSLSPEDVNVQAVVGKVGPNRELIQSRVEGLAFAERDNLRYVFKGTIECDFPGYQGYTIRVIPKHADVRIPSELGIVVWE